MTERSTDQMARDLENQAKTITEIVINQRAMGVDLAELKQERAVAEVEDKFRDEKLKSITDMGKLVVTTVVVLFVGAVFAALKLGLFSHVG